jgi:hypothetical protein
VLCAVALGVIGLGAWASWAVGEEPLSEDAVSLGLAGVPVVGALIAARMPANPYGWVWCGVGLAFASADGARPIVRLSGGPAWLAWLLEVFGWVPFLGLMTLVFLLFPTGRLPSSRWRWLGRAAVVVPTLVVLVGLVAPNLDDPSQSTPWALRGTAGHAADLVLLVGVYVLFGLVLVAITSLVPRFRRADAVERLQLTWFLYAAGAYAVLFALNAFGVALPSQLDGVVYGIGFALLPVSVGIAVLRYRLYDIDRIVSRTVSYGVLTAALVALYLLVVALLRPLLEPLTGSSSLAVAASTLAVAAVFNPARRRLQAAVDRRFDRARYDAARAVDGFAARLRDQVDLDEVTTRLRDTVTATVAPTRVAVWLREPARHGEAKS